MKKSGAYDMSLDKTAIQYRLCRMLERRGIEYDTFHFGMTGHWEIRYAMPGSEFTNKITPKSLICDQDWIDLPVIKLLTKGT